MKRFELIEHTADTGLVACGADLGEAFTNAAYGLFSIITDVDCVRQERSRTVNVSAGDLPGLLFKWINELIYVFEVERLLFSRFKVLSFSEEELEVECWGEEYDPSRHELKMGVKSATYHMLKIDSERNCVQVIFDV